MEPDREKITLTPADAAAVDALLNGEAGAAPARRQRAQAWLQVLDGSPMPEPAGDLAARTIAAVEADRMNLSRARDHAGPQTAAHDADPARVPGRWRRRLAEFGAMAVAAMLVLAVTLEGLGQARKSEARTACAGNLKLFVNAFNAYSAEGGNGVLPVLAMPVNSNWLTGNHAPGEMAVASNAANLMPLVTRNLIQAKALFCAGAGLPDGPVVMTADHMPAIGYSYRDMSVTDKPRWVDQTIVMTDKNPVFGSQVRPELADNNSPNHDGKGTYVLRANGSVTWETHPNVGPDHDNIWTIGNGKDRLTAYSGREMPAGLKDVFVCP